MGGLFLCSIVQLTAQAPHFVGDQQREGYKIGHPERDKVEHIAEIPITKSNGYAIICHHFSRARCAPALLFLDSSLCFLLLRSYFVDVIVRQNSSGVPLTFSNIFDRFTTASNTKKYQGMVIIAVCSLASLELHQLKIVIICCVFSVFARSSAA